MLIELWHTYHFITFGIFAFVILLFAFILNKKEQGAQKKVLLVLAFINLAIHFLKLLIPEYRETLPTSFKNVTFENICGSTTIMMPFIILSNNKFMKDYIFYIGVLAGLVAIIYPAEVLGKELVELDVIRFYISNILIFIVPFFMVYFRIHELSLKRVPAFPLIFLMIECLILANETILMEAGFVDFRGGDFLSYNYRNSNFIFGPTTEFKGLSDKFIDPLVPNFFKTVGAGDYQGMTKYIPVVWLIVPCFIYFNLLGAILCLFVTKILKK